MFVWSTTSSPNVRRSSTLAWLTISALACCSASSCALKGCGEQQPIVYVDVEEGELDRKRLESSIAVMIEELPGFEFRHEKPGETAWELQVRVLQVRERSAIPEGDQDAEKLADWKRRAVSIGLVLRPKIRSEGSAVTTDVFLAKNVPPGFSIDDLAAEALLEGGKDLHDIRSMYEADADRIIQLMSDPEERRRRLAVTLARDRKLVEAGPRLIELVKDEKSEEAIVLSAIGALVAIRDPNAAQTLIDLARRRPSYVTQIVFALGDLGGREAKGYLFTVQSGHPNEALKKLAREALEELEARETRE